MRASAHMPVSTALVSEPAPKAPAKVIPFPSRWRRLWRVLTCQHQHEEFLGIERPYAPGDSREFRVFECKDCGAQRGEPIE